MLSSSEKILSAHYVAPVFTPRDTNRKVNFGIIPTYVNFLISNKVQGVLVGGSAGQGILQSNKERVDVARAFIRAAAGRIAVIVHAGGVNYEDTIALCKELSSMDGVDGIMLSSPMFYPYFNYTGLLEYLTDAARACEGKPVLYYHFPSLTRLQYPVVDLMRDMKLKTANFVGLKYTANDEAVYRDLVKLDLKIFLGFPNMALVGAQTQGDEVSLITGPTNFINGLMVKIVDQVLSGDNDKAKATQEELNRFMGEIIIDQELMSSMTQIMDHIGLFTDHTKNNRIGIPMGPPVLPLNGLSDVQKQKLNENLDKSTETGKLRDLLDG